MDKQPPNKITKPSQPKPWSDAELRRVARVFDLLIRIDKRQIVLLDRFLDIFSKLMLDTFRPNRVKLEYLNTPTTHSP